MWVLGLLIILPFYWLFTAIHDNPWLLAPVLLVGFFIGILKILMNPVEGVRQAEQRRMRQAEKEIRLLAEYAEEQLANEVYRESLRNAERWKT
ncbi:hypothetical protein AHiyo6_00240 [Arthrobacter sp. Hiyo6]|nr:hypothetical protein AHiyo6_00240 [Arthrobacter sp. Hiyo6]